MLFTSCGRGVNHGRTEEGEGRNWMPCCVMFVGPAASAARYVEPATLVENDYYRSNQTCVRSDKEMSWVPSVLDASSGGVRGRMEPGVCGAQLAEAIQIRRGGQRSQTAPGSCLRDGFPGCCRLKTAPSLTHIVPSAGQWAASSDRSFSDRLTR